MSISGRYLYTLLTLLLFGSATLRAGVSFAQNQYEVVVAPGFNHVPASIPYTLDPTNFDESAISVSTDVSWATPVVNEADDSIDITFSTEDIISTYTATITINDGTATTQLFLTASVSPLNIYRLVDDPLRPVTYGIQMNGIYKGCIVSYDPINQAPLECITVSERPTDFVINDDASELLVICSAAKSIEVIDLNTFTIKEHISLPTYGAWGDADDTTANIELGPGNIIYYLDGSWGPTLHVLDRTSGTVIQSMQWNGSTPSNTTGFMDFAVTSDRSRIIAMPQYGWSAGSHSSIIGHYTVAADGKVTFVKQSSVNGLSREPFEAPVLMRDDDKVAILKTVAADPADTDIQFRSFPSTIWSMTEDGGIVATSNTLYDYDSGLELYQLPNMSSSGSGYHYRFAQAFTSDYTYFVYFNPSTRELLSINLVDEIGLDAIGRFIFPADGSVVTPPANLSWTSVIGVDQYDLYLGDSMDDVLNADSSSPEYLGRQVGTDYEFDQLLTSGKTYYWRVDPVNSQGIYKGLIYTFTVSDISLDRPEIEVATVTGHQDFRTAIELSSDTTQAWSVTSDDSWVSFPVTSGTTPASLAISIDASDLVDGYYETTIRIDTPSGELEVPLALEVEPLKLTHIRSDRESDTIYAISEDTSATIPQAYLLEINSSTEQIERVLRVGASVTDFTISYADDRILVANWKSGNLLVVNQTDFELIESISFKPAGATGYSQGDVYRVAAGVAGRVVVEEEDQWIDIDLYDTTNKQILASAGVREGGGAFGPTGRYYYHGENNSSGASIQKFDIAGDALTMLKEVRPAEITSYYGSRTVIVSEDGSRIYWAGVLLDSNLNTEWGISQIIYSTSGDGRYAFSQTGIYDVNLRRQVLSMPTTSTVSGFNSTTSKLLVQVGDELKFFPFTQPITLPTPVLSADGSTANSIKLNWTDESLEMEFNIQKRLAGAAIWEDLTPQAANATSYTVTNLTESTDYEFRIRASSPDYSSDWSNVLAVKTTTTPPATPHFQTVSAYWDRVDLAWSNVANETAYFLERSVGDSDSWVKIADLDADVTTASDTSILHGETYKYRVKAVKDDVSSGYSSVRTVTIPVRSAPVTPTSIRVTVVDETELVVSWSNVADEDGYRLERRAGGGAWVLLADLPADDISYTDKSVSEGIQYDYRVIAYNSVGIASPTTIASGVPAIIVVLLEDDFDPDIQAELWQSVTGASVIEGNVGFNGSKALWFGLSGTRQARTVPIDLTDAVSINFSMRAGNQNVDGSQYWNNSEAGETVLLEYTTGGNIWNTIQAIDTSYTNLAEWESFNIAVPASAMKPGVQLRWRQLANSGASLDQWAIDDFYINQDELQLEPPVFLISSANSPTRVGLYWVASSLGDLPTHFAIERRTELGPWEEIDEVPASQNFYNDTGLTPSSLYLYRVIARNGSFDSQPSYLTIVETFSFFVQWLMDNYGSTDVQQIAQSESGGTHPMVRFAFNMKSDGWVGGMPEDGYAGLPRSFCIDGYLHLEFVRWIDQEGAGVDYVCEFSYDLSDWEESEVIISATPIDSDWERVVVRDVKPTIANEQRFGRVMVKSSTAH